MDGFEPYVVEQTPGGCRSDFQTKPTTLAERSGTMVSYVTDE